MSNRYLPALIPLVAAAALLMVWGVLVNTLPRPLPVAESNLMAGLSRLQSLARIDEPAGILCGTSIIAKLDAGKIFDGSGSPVINLGLDGGSSLFALEQVVASPIVPAVVVIETNLMSRIAAGNTATLVEASDSLWFRFASRWSALRVENRPSTYLYAWLKTIKDRGANTDAKPTNWMNERLPEPEIPEMPTGMSAEETALVEKWLVLINALQNSGASVVLTTVPDNNSTGEKDARIARAVGAQADLLHIDLRSGISAGSLAYSDGTHLVESSALKVSNALNSELRSAGLLGLK